MEQKGADLSVDNKSHSPPCNKKDMKERKKPRVQASSYYWETKGAIILIARKVQQAIYLKFVFHRVSTKTTAPAREVNLPTH